MTEDELDEESSTAFKNSLEDHFGDIEDYRRQGMIRHKLLDILFITICAVVCGANDLKAVAMYAKHKKRWLTETLRLPSGLPSYSTLWTVFALLSPASLEQCFVRWVQSKLGAGKEPEGERQISFDGKAQWGTANEGEPHSFVHIVSAWTTSRHLTLGQLKVDGKSNEITAIPKLLDLVDVEGAVVTIDAMGCQTAIAEKITAKGGDYLLALKGNQSSLSNEVENYFQQAESIGFEGIACDAVGSQDCGHGRRERREVYVTEDIDWLPQKDAWQKLKTIIMVKSERKQPNQPTSIERRYYLASLPADAMRVSTLTRRHWGIENQAHWILDVAFREDEQNANAGNIAENMSMVRFLSLNLLKQDKTAKCGIEIKRQIAGWDEEYLLRVIGVKCFS